MSDGFLREMLTLDDVDRGLIHALSIDGRAPFGRIAEVLGTSGQTVARRYRRLRAEAALRVVGLPNPDRAGQTQWLIRLTATPSTVRDLSHSLARRADTSWVKLASGGTEIFAVIHAPTGAQAVPSLLLHDIPRRAGITAVSAHCLLHTYLGGPTGWRGRLETLTDQQQQRLAQARDTDSPARRPSPTHQSAHPPSSTRQSARQPSPTDRQTDQSIDQLAGQSAGRWGQPADRPPLARADHDLIDALRHDGRATHADLAVATGVSQATVARRLAELRANGTIFFDVEVAPAVLGATTQALLWMSVQPGHLDRVATTLAGHRELALVAATTGRTNLLANALCRSPADLHDYLTHRLGGLDAIHTLETAPVLHTVKAAGPLIPMGTRAPSSMRTDTKFPDRAS
ncbi:Lrp/AsnC family transcriptional regulator [Nonomuraea sp. NPDC049158]|uniref:Lrp/AsnC family transcriptional regulator n=1 Tax=Nonomuraea sp. NPDC049158 TaxID=3155649 RepID=UPI0033C8D7B0